MIQNCQVSRILTKNHIRVNIHHPFSWPKKYLKNSSTLSLTLSGLENLSDLNYSKIFFMGFQIQKNDLDRNPILRVPLNSTPPQFNTKGPLIFSPQNLSVHHTSQFNTPFSSTHSSVQHQNTLSSTHPERFSVLIWWVFGVELRDFGCWKGMVLVLNWGVLIFWLWISLTFKELMRLFLTLWNLFESHESIPTAWELTVINQLSIVLKNLTKNRVL